MNIHSKNSKDIREFKRLRAVELYEGGMKQIKIAKALDVTRGAVSQWLKKYREYGREALLHKKVTKKRSLLSEQDKKSLVDLLEMGPEAFGFKGHIWTRKRVGQVIETNFGVRYHEVHVGRILKSLGWSWQKPAKQAIQRDEEAVKIWSSERLPEIKKKPWRKTGQ